MNRFFHWLGFHRWEKMNGYPKIEFCVNCHLYRIYQFPHTEGDGEYFYFSTMSELQRIKNIMDGIY